MNTHVYIKPCLRENLLQRLRRKPLSRSEILLYSAELVKSFAVMREGVFLTPFLRLKHSLASIVLALSTVTSNRRTLSLMFMAT
jgi:hypothetical protein